VQAAAWGMASRHWPLVSAGIATALDVAAHVRPTILTGASNAARRVAGADVVPQWAAGMPSGGAKRTAWQLPGSTAIYFPACVGTMFGPEGGAGVQQAFLELCRRAGIHVSIPDGIDAMCCGTPWKSKGMTEGYERMGHALTPWLWEATRHGELPVVCDAASCTEGLHGLLSDVERTHGRRIEVVDAVAFVAESVLPRLTTFHRLSSIALHPTCSSTHLDVNGALHSLAEAIADEVVVPDGWGCCAFAGDRGMLHPELTESATAAEAAAVTARRFDAYASLNRTCEIGLTRATGRPYRHIIEIVAEATRP
jgi:D-lactate dehydrogenase